MILYVFEPGGRFFHRHHQSAAAAAATAAATTAATPPPPYDPGYDYSTRLTDLDRNNPQAMYHVGYKKKRSRSCLTG